LYLTGCDHAAKNGEFRHIFGNTRILQVFHKNTADYCFKMYAHGRVWLADLMGDQPELLVTEKKGCFEGSFVGNVGMPGSRDMAGE